MKLKFTSWLLVTIVSAQLNAQLCGPLTDPYSCTLSREASDSVMRRKFAEFATGKTDAFNLTNYASFNPLDNSRFSFNTYFGFSSATSLSFSGEGGLINENVGQLFSKGKFNNSTSLKAQLYLRLKGSSNYLIYDCKAIMPVREQIRQLEIERDSKIEAVDRSLNKLYIDTLWMTVRNNVLQYKTDSVAKIVSSLKSSAGTALSDMKAYDSINALLGLMEKYRLESDSINKRLDSSRYVIRLDNAWKKRDTAIITTLSYGEYVKVNNQYVIENGEILRRDYRVRLKQKICSDYADKVLELEKNIPLSGITLMWVSPIIKFTNKEFRMYKSYLPLSDRIQKDDLTSLDYGAEFNWLHIDSLFKKSQFFNLGILHQKGNNLQDLSTTTVTVETKATDNNTTHDMKQDYKVYTDSIETFKLWKPYFNFYYLFGNSRTDALHLFSEVEFRSTRNNVWNGGVGYVFGLNNSKQAKTILNIEIFFKANDIANTLVNTSHVWKRTDISLSFTVPFIPSPSK